MISPAYRALLLTEIAVNAIKLCRDALTEAFPPGEAVRVGAGAGTNLIGIVLGPSECIGSLDIGFENGNVWSKPVHSLVPMPWDAVPEYYRKVLGEMREANIGRNSQVELSTVANGVSSQS